MSKAILILDKMPGCCFACPLCEGSADNPIGYGYCAPLDREMRFEDYEVRPDWCPLQKMPGKEATHSRIDYDEGFAEGWNGFRTEIGGNDLLADKPRLCEILGVEPLEHWTLPKYGDTVFVVDGNGEFLEIADDMDYDNVENAYVLLDAIDRSDQIIHLSAPEKRWMKDDIKDAQAVARLFHVYPYDSVYIQRLETGKVWVLSSGTEDNASEMILNKITFPSLKKLEAVKLLEILKCEE